MVICGNKSGVLRVNVLMRDSVFVGGCGQIGSRTTGWDLTERRP